MCLFVLGNPSQSMYYTSLRHKHRCTTLDVVDTLRQPCQPCRVEQRYMRVQVFPTVTEHNKHTMSRVDRPVLSSIYLPSKDGRWGFVNGNEADFSDPVSVE